MQHRFTSTAFLIWGGLLIWMTYFVFVYVFAALACARGFANLFIAGARVVPFTTSLATVFALAGTLLWVWRAMRLARQKNDTGQPGKLIGFLAVALGLLAVIAIVWSALPPLLLRNHC